MKYSPWKSTSWIVASAPLWITIAIGTPATMSLLQQKNTTEHIEILARTSSRLETALNYLQDRHNRTGRRVREALLTHGTENQLAILAWSAQHYEIEMTRLLHNVQSELEQASAAVNNSRWRDDLKRVGRQLDRLSLVVEKMSPAIDASLEAVASQDFTLLDTASIEIERQDKDAAAKLRLASLTLRRAIHRQLLLNTATLPRPKLGAIIFLVATLAILLALLSAWLVHRIVRISERPDSAKTNEEKWLASIHSGLREECLNLENTISEITLERDKQEQSSRRSQRELALFQLYNENLINSLSSAIVVTDANGLLIAVNRAARAFFGAPTSTTGTPFSKNPLALALNKRGADLSDANTSPHTRRYDSVILQSGIYEKLLDVILVPYLDERGQSRGLIIVAEDITDEIAVKNQLLAAERLAAVGRIAAQVAHEIRNPLSAIGLNAELLEEEIRAKLDHESLTLVQAISTEVDRLTNVTEAYLELTRLPQPVLQSEDINALVADLFSMLAEELRNASVDVRFEYAAPGPQALADTGQIRQALLNIVRNSREAMPEGGQLQVVTGNAEDNVFIEVSDNGSGIPEDIITRVHEPFFTTKTQGTGLGLSITRQIIEEHHGRLEIISSGGEGTRCRIWLKSSD